MVEPADCHAGHDGGGEIVGDSWTDAVEATPAGFDPKARYVVQSTVERWRGKNYRRGEEFPAAALERVRRRLYRERRIALASAAGEPVSAALAATEAVVTVKPVAPAPVAPTPAELRPSELPTPPGSGVGAEPRFVARHRGNGRWGVIDTVDGSTVAAGLTKEEAEELALEHNTAPDHIQGIGPEAA